MEQASVLVIDDEPCIQSLLKDILLTCSVHIASTGQEAIEQLTNGSFDIIFCDLKMSDISGMEIYEYVRENRPCVATRIVFMTGGAFTQDAHNFLLNLQHPVIQKPFDIAKIRYLVRTYAAHPEASSLIPSRQSALPDT